MAFPRGLAARALHHAAPARCAHLDTAAAIFPGDNHRLANATHVPLLYSSDCELRKRVPSRTFPNGRVLRSIAVQVRFASCQAAGMDEDRVIARSISDRSVRAIGRRKCRRRSIKSSTFWAEEAIDDQLRKRSLCLECDDTISVTGCRRIVLSHASAIENMGIRYGCPGTQRSGPTTLDEEPQSGPMQALSQEQCRYL
jgi:hypothetical protein